MWETIRTWWIVDADGQEMRCQDLRVLERALEETSRASEVEVYEYNTRKRLFYRKSIEGGAG